MSEQQALEARAPGFLELIEKVVTSPEISVEKVKALLDMQLQMEDRRAAAEFSTDMIAAQGKIQALPWDKANPHTKSNFVSYPRIEKMLRPVREEFGFTQSFDTEPSANQGEMIMCCDVSHRGGHTRRYRLPMPIDGAGPKGGGVMTGPQAVGNGTSYGMRYLDKMIWNIPMLVDKDDMDGNEPRELITEKQAADLKAMIEDVGADEKKFLQYMATVCKCIVAKVADIPASHYQAATTALKKKREAA